MGDLSPFDTVEGVIHGWDICKTSSLTGAAQLLRTRHVSVALLMLNCESRAVPEIDAFLREHGQVQWVAVCHPVVLEQERYRQLVSEHCCDFHTWPVDGPRLQHTLGHAHGLAALQRAPRTPPTVSKRLVGRAPATWRLLDQTARVAPVRAPVLIWGESGTGKELVAQAVHEQSPYADGPFVAINCGAIAPGLVQSELFGYERGAFTGASQCRAGLLESANGGTIFLDEIGDLPLGMQANLLRFLQEKSLLRVGGTRPVPVDARVIAASHVDLEAAVACGAFRQDLYYRLNVLTIMVPPLRERKEDLELLAAYFFERYAAERSPRLQGYSGAAHAAMRQHNWPGNVRELINRVRRALVMAEGRLVQPADLGLAEPCDGPADCVPLGGVRVRAERQAIEVSLRNGKSVTRVAEELGVSRMTLYRLMAKHGIDVPSRSRAK